MRRILYWLGLVDLVWTKDSDGDTRLRIVRYDKESNCYAYDFSWDYLVRLRHDGSTVGGHYVKNWFPYEKKPGRKLTVKGSFEKCMIADRLKGN